MQISEKRRGCGAEESFQGPSWFFHARGACEGASVSAGAKQIAPDSHTAVKPEGCQRVPYCCYSWNDYA